MTKLILIIFISCDTTALAFLNGITLFRAGRRYDSVSLVAVTQRLNVVSFIRVSAVGTSECCITLCRTGRLCYRLGIVMTQHRDNFFLDSTAALAFALLLALLRCCRRDSGLPAAPVMTLRIGVGICVVVCAP